MNQPRSAKCHALEDPKQIQQQLHYDGEHSCRAPSAPRPPAIAPPRPVAVQPSHRLPAANAPPSIVRRSCVVCVDAPSLGGSRSSPSTDHSLLRLRRAQCAVAMMRFKVGGVYNARTEEDGMAGGLGIPIKVTRIADGKIWFRARVRLDSTATTRARSR